MPLPGNNNSISFSQIQTEFGGSNPINFSEYLRNGGNVNNSTDNQHIPLYNANNKEVNASDFFGLNGWSADQYELITSSNTSWTPSYSGWETATVYVIGGGGSGGSVTDGDASAASGGGAGGTAIRAYTKLVSSNISVGSGGSAVSGYNNGNDGGTTSFTPGATSVPTNSLTGGKGKGGVATHGGSQNALATTSNSSGYGSGLSGGQGTQGSTNYWGSDAHSTNGRNSSHVGGAGGSVSLTSQVVPNISGTQTDQGVFAWTISENSTAATPTQPTPTQPSHWSSFSALTSLTFRGGAGTGGEGANTVAAGSNYGAGGGANSNLTSGASSGAGAQGCVIIIYEG
jgi:hypothetical protein